MMGHLVPNESPQIMPIDHGLLLFKQPGPQIRGNTLWVLTDFIAGHGARTVVVGNHKWPDGFIHNPPMTFPRRSWRTTGTSSMLVWYGTAVEENHPHACRAEITSGDRVGWDVQQKTSTSGLPQTVTTRDQSRFSSSPVTHSTVDVWDGLKAQDPHVVLKECYSDDITGRT